MSSFQMHRRLFLLAPLGVAACASAEPRYFRLAIPEGTPLPGPSLQVELRQARLARYLDRPEIFRGAGATRLVLAENARWAEPLEEMISRLLAAALTQRLPGSVVREERSALGGRLDLLASLDIARFEVAEDGAALLQGRFALRRPGEDNALADRGFEARGTAGAGTAEAVTAQGALLGQLADQMAAAIRALPAARRR